MNLDMPLYYHRIGLMPIPVKDKVAIESWKQYQEVLSPEQTVREWFLKHKAAGLALLTGPVSKIIVLDLDGQDALDAVKQYPMPKTWIAKTRKGYHYYFQWDDRADFPTTITKLNGMSGVDVRGRGGYVVAPPSYDVYSWVPGYAPWDVGLASLPEWLLGLLSYHKLIIEGTNKIVNKPENTWLSDILNGVGVGERHSALVKLCGYYLSRMPEDIATHHLLEWNQKNNPPISMSEIRSTISDVAKRYNSGEYQSKFTKHQGNDTQDEDDNPLVPVNVSHFLDAASPKIDWFVQNLIPYQTSTIIGGMQGIGKSWALLDLAIEAAKGGGKWFNYLPVNKAKVLYVDEESHENLLRYRLKKLVAGKEMKNIPSNLHLLVGKNFSFTSESKLTKFKSLLTDLKPDLIIMDSLICLHHLDENSAKDMRIFFKIVKKIIDEFHCTFLFADHEGKGSPNDKGFRASHRLRGSSAKGDATDTVISMAKKGPHLVVEHTKARYYKPIPAFAASITDLTENSTVVECLGYIGD